MKTVLIAFFIAISPAFCFAQVDKPVGNAGSDPIFSDKSYFAAVAYDLSSRLYWKIYPFTDDSLEYDKTADGWQVYKLLGTRIYGDVYKQGNTYGVIFDSSLPYPFYYATTLKQGANSIWLRSAFGDAPPKEKLPGRYAIDIPANFVDVASEFDDYANATMEKLPKALKRLVDDEENAPLGENHLYVGPFKSCVFPEGIHIYWKEMQADVIARPIDHSLDIADWPSHYFKVTTFIYAETPKSAPLKAVPNYDEKSAFYSRYSNSNVIVANCVRDGRLITIIKKTPPAPASKP